MNENKVLTIAETKEIVKSIVWHFKNCKIKSDKQAKECLTLKRLGSGAFREAYLINNAAVVKFPIGDHESNLYHSQKEIAMIRKINNKAKYRALRPFLPKVYYTDYRHGILIVERCYKLKAGIPYIVADIIGKVFEAIINQTSWSADIEYYNVMENAEGEYRLIDLGLLR
jgi:hypothetical protein